MKVAGKIIFAAALAVLGGVPAFGQADVAVRQDVEFLSDPVCGGRATGTPGASEATWYILRRLRSAGLEPSMQTFD